MKASRKTGADQESSALERLAIERLARNEGVSLPALVDDLSKDLGCTKDKVIEGVMELQSRKVVYIAEKTPFASFASYSVSPVSMWFWGAVSATLLSVALVFVTSGVALYLRYVFGGLLVLFLPGYSLIELLYSKKELDGLARFALSVGLSLALVPLIGLALNYTPLGIRLLPVALSLSGVTLVFLVIALRRKYSNYKAERDLA